jgi:hypothetical protein
MKVTFTLDADDCTHLIAILETQRQLATQDAMQADEPREKAQHLRSAETAGRLADLIFPQMRHIYGRN